MTASSLDNIPLSEPAPDRSISGAVHDVLEGARRFRLAFNLGWQDAMLPYRRALLGPLWLSIIPGLWAGIISAVFYRSLGGGRPEYVLYVFSGIVFFQFAQAMLVSGTSAFQRSTSIIRNIPTPLFLHVLRTVMMNLQTLMAQLPMVGVVYLLSGGTLTSQLLLLVPGIVLVSVTLAGAALVLACATTIVRDLSHAVSAVMRVSFFATPVFWYADGGDPIRLALVQYNPFAHGLNILRDPLLGLPPNETSWAVCAAMMVVFWALGIVLFARFRMRIVSFL